jgi:hypothetical protein
MLVRKKAKACGIVLYGIVLGLVLALPGCNADWPLQGRRRKRICFRITIQLGGTKTANDRCNLVSK